MKYSKESKCHKVLRLADAAMSSYIRSTWSEHTMYLAETAGNYLLEFADEAVGVEAEPIDELKELIESIDDDTLYRVSKFLWVYGFTTERAYKLIKEELAKRDAYRAQ